MSGFEGDIQIAWDNSSLALLRTCAYKYYLSQVLGLKPKGGNVHLDFGAIYHQSLEFYDRLRVEGIGLVEAQNQTMREVLRLTQGWPHQHKIKTREALVRAVMGYIDHFRNDTAKTVILDNGQAAVELSFRHEIELKNPFGKPYILCGHLDKIADFQEGLWVLDRKTTTKMWSDDYIKTFKPSGQMEQYTWGSKVVFHPEIKGVLIDAVYVGSNMDTFSRFPASYTPGMLDQWFKNTMFYIKMAEQYHTQKYWPQNFEACHVYAGCQFRSICGRDPKMAEMVIQSEFVVERWDPLVTREKVE